MNDFELIILWFIYATLWHFGAHTDHINACHDDWRTPKDSIIDIMIICCSNHAFGICTTTNIAQNCAVWTCMHWSELDY